MTDSGSVRRLLLDNGIVLTFFDRSNRYFGDFHRVLVVVEGVVDAELTAPVEAAPATDDGQGKVLFCRELERMGVPSERREEVVAEMIDSFIVSTRGYLERADMPEQLRKKYLAEQNRRRAPLHTLRPRI